MGSRLLSCKLVGHSWRAYREQFANPEALPPASPLSLAEFDPLR